MTNKDKQFVLKELASIQKQINSLVQRVDNALNGRVDVTNENVEGTRTDITELDITSLEQQENITELDIQALEQQASITELDIQALDHEARISALEGGN